MSDAIAYCGAPPTPASLIGAWNLDPVLIALLAFAAALTWRRATRPGPAWIAWALAVLFFVSPLCNLTSALFSARVLHHVALTAAIAPLAVAGFGLHWRAASGGAAAGATLALTAAMWLWHAPGPYAWALSTVPGYWLMQATLLGSALWAWSVILGDETGSAVATAFGSFVQMGLLGAIIVFAGSPLYALHLLTTEPFGLSALDDQRVAGLLMWVAAAGPFMGAIIARIAAVAAFDESAAA